MAENRADFVIQGLTSEQEVREIQDELGDVDGVMTTEIELDSGEAKIHYDYDILSEEKIKRTIRDLGYELE